MMRLPDPLQLRDRLRPWQQRFDARTPRERVLLIAVAAVLSLALADALWLSPASQAWSQARREHQAALAAQAQLQADLQRLAQLATQRQQQDRAELTAWRQRVRETDSALRSHEASLVGPDQMLDLLDHVLAGHGQVRVRAMRSLGRTDLLALPAPGTPATAATPAAAASAAASLAGSDAAPPSLYRHGVELVLEGSYIDLLAYLRALEALPQHLLWGGLQLKVGQHPTTVLTLRLYTLSRDRNWIAI
ncbi:MAG: type II secretion system protein M [Burkholderiaceae bacterium]|nr:type II secretion system protein M [Burkholderiaceae bacterium]